MNKRETLVMGLVLGAGLMYLLDPERGRSFGARVRNRLTRSASGLGDLGAEVVSRARHFRNRADPSASSGRFRIPGGEVDDAVLEARVRSELGRFVSDPTGVGISAEHGRVTLRGHANGREVTALVDGVQAIPGVHDVINRLESRENAG